LAEIVSPDTPKLFLVRGGRPAFSGRVRMKKRFRIATVPFCFGIALVLCGAIAGRSYSIDSPQEKAFKLRADSELVLLDVSVKAPRARGGWVSGLSKESFTVFENGRPQPVLQFASTDTPVTVGLVVDNSGSMRRKQAEVALAGLAFAKESNLFDEFFVLNFNDYVVFGLPAGVRFTDKLQLLRNALHFGTPAGRTALYDGMALGLSHIRLGSKDKHTLIVVSDGGDNASHISFHDLLQMLEASPVTVYTVGIFEADDVDRNPGVLRRIAQVSGGEYFQVGQIEEVVPVFHKIAQDIRNRYTVGFRPDPTLDRDANPLRTVKVAVTLQGKKLVAHTRTSYTLRPWDELITEAPSSKKEEHR
jgi:VWFA-related protein